MVLMMQYAIRDINRKDNACMQTCVYMSNRKIQVAVGNPKNHSIAVKRLYETEAPEGGKTSIG